MQHDCKAFREEWLARPHEPRELDAACAGCAAWIPRAQCIARALTGLARLPAPEALSARVNEELLGKGVRLARILESLSRHGAPSELDARVQGILGSFDPETEALDEGGKSRAVGALDLVPAPHVLERLVDEELREPERHRVERFSRSLPRLRAPDELGERIRMGARRQALSRLVYAPALALAAALLVVWVAVRRVPDTPRTYRFEVERRASLEGIEPRALALAESLVGQVSLLGGPR